MDVARAGAVSASEDERDLVRLINVSGEEEYVARSDSSGDKDGRGRVQDTAICAEGVVGHIELALPTMDLEGVEGLRKSKWAPRARNGECVGDVVTKNPYS